MSKFTIEIATDNDAFQPDWQYETERILREAIEWIRQGHFDRQLYDINGNTIGSYSYGGE